MALTELQRNKIVDGCMSQSATNLWKYVSMEETTAQMEALIERMQAKGLDAAKSQFLMQKIHQPDPQEQAEWSNIEANLSGWDDVQKTNALTAYISKWQASKPWGNHLDDARKQKSMLEEAVEWMTLNKNDRNAIKFYLTKHPDTGHFEEIEAALWGMVDVMDSYSLHQFVTDMPNSVHAIEAKQLLDDLDWNAVNKTNVDELHIFIQMHPLSAHVTEAQVIILAFTKWDEVRNSGDILVVKNYLDDISESTTRPFYEEAQLLYLQMKTAELKEMHRLVNQYNKFLLERLLDNNIFTKQELIHEGLFDEESFNKFQNPPLVPVLEMTKSVTECPSAHTDIFLFGIPATGKTCVLMGILNSDKLTYDSAIMGGEYAANLTEYVRAGRVPKSTEGSFTTAVKATIKDRDNKGEVKKVYPVNFIEMSGEEFAFRIARNESISFDSMGTGAASILQNDNRKAIFIVLDPTQENVQQKHKYTINGESREEVVFVSQRLMLNKLFSLFQQPENAHIADLIDSFHFIVTKADLLGNDIERENRAQEIIRKRHGDVIPDIVDFCKANGINKNTDGHPKLFTFSLGKFYLGDIYRYDSADSDVLINAFTEYLGGIKPHSVFEKIMGIFNRGVM